MYDLKMALFDNRDPEWLFFSLRNFNMAIDVSGTIVANAELQYLCALLCGEALRNIDTL